MSARRTNVGLGVLVVLALTTGTLAYAFGTPVLGGAVVITHGVVGLGVALLSPWKQAIARRGVRRRREGWQLSLAMAVLVVVTVVTGIAHAAGLRILGLGLTTMQVHVTAAITAGVLVVWHAFARPSRPRSTDLSRRALLRTTAWASAAGLVWLGTEGAWRAVSTRGARRRFTGSHEVGTDAPAMMPVTQWAFDSVPRLDPQTWRVRVTGPRGTRLLGLADLDTDDAVRATLDCTGGWYAAQDWAGVRLRRLLGDVGAARSIVIGSATGYARRFSVDELDSLVLATHVGGAGLSAGHGAPARLVAPGHRGYWWVKWVTSITLEDTPAWRQTPFPLG